MGVLESDLVYRVMKKVKVEEHRWEWVRDSVWETIKDARERHFELAKENVIAFVKSVYVGHVEDGKGAENGS